MNCFAWSWHVEQGICAAGCSAVFSAAGIGAGAGVGAGGWGGVAGGCCADRPSASRRASPPRVSDRFDIGILRGGHCGPLVSNLRYRACTLSTAQSLPDPCQVAQASAGVVLPGNVAELRYAYVTASLLSWQPRHAAVAGPCGEK